MCDLDGGAVGGTIMSDGDIYAAVLHALGATPRYELFPAPVPTIDDVVVTVTAAALKPADRLMARGVHYAPSRFPHVAGLDGVGRLVTGQRVAFMIPQPPYGGMAERTLVRRNMWLPVPDVVDDVTAAAFANPGMAAWKAMIVDGQLTAGQSALVLGATGMSGRIATQIAVGLGARVVVAGRNRRVLRRLLDDGASAAIALDLPHDEVTDAVHAEGPYDLVADYVWGAPAEAVFAAFERGGRPSSLTRYIVIGMAAGATAALPAMALRRMPVQIVGSGVVRVAIDEVAAAFEMLLHQVVVGQIALDIEPVPLSEVEATWERPTGDRRIVFLP